MSSPQHDTIQTVYRLRRYGAPSGLIARLVGYPKTTVRRWLADPTWHPEIDRVAIERAFRGRWDMYEALTRWERDEFLDLLDEELLRSAILREEHWLKVEWAGPRWEQVTQALRRRRQVRE
jgi:hypothetical protein